MLLTCICTKFLPAIALQFLRIRHRRPFGPDPSPFGSPPERDVRPRFNPPFRHLRPSLPSHHATSASSFGLNLQPLPDCLTQPRLQPSGIRFSRPATCASVFRHPPDCLMRPPRQPSGIRPAACAAPTSTSGPGPRNFVTKCLTFRYAPHIGKLPLAAALSPTL